MGRAANVMYIYCIICLQLIAVHVHLRTSDKFTEENVKQAENKELEESIYNSDIMPLQKKKKNSRKNMWRWGHVDLVTMTVSTTEKDCMTHFQSACF